MKCIYCGEEILGRINHSKDGCCSSNQSSEHVINNELGGTLECDAICCKTCNTRLSNQDRQFASNFAPYVSLIKDLHKTRNSKVKPKHQGVGILNGECYDIEIEGDRPVKSAMYSKKHKTGVMPQFDTIIHNVRLDNDTYKRGMQKIAVNFAVYSGIQIDILSDNFTVEKDAKGKVSKIDYRQRFLPFLPLNSFDCYVEQANLARLYHMLILFSANGCLYCYIDLFNTWQGYVVLSTCYHGKRVYETYVQHVESWERQLLTSEDINSMKDLNIVMLQYGIDGSGTYEEQKEATIKKANQKIQEESYKRELESFILDILGLDYSAYMIRNMIQRGVIVNAHDFYVFSDENEQDRLAQRRFRRLTPLESKNGINQCAIYPEEIAHLLHEEKAATKAKLREYGHKKAERLTDYLQLHEDVGE